MAKGFNEYRIDGEVTTIFLRGSLSEEHPTTIIDTKNLQKLIDANLSWHPHFEPNKKCLYIFASEYLGIINNKPKYKVHKLYRFVLGETDSRVLIDHINNDTFDNRECNLRRTTHAKNMKNRREKNSNNTSGYRNVCKINGKWVIQIQVDGKNKVLGRFKDINEASEFAEKMRKQYYGEFAGQS
jgi:hypothetical protein